MAQDHSSPMLSLLQTVRTGNAKTDRDLRLLCDVDWNSTSLGPLSSWSQDLLTLVYLAMLSPQPQLFLLGTEPIFVYNTAYSLLLRDHHPAYFAQPVASLERLQPQADAIGQVMKDAMESRRPATQTDRPFFFDNGKDLEEIFLSATMVLLPPHLQGFQATTDDTTLAVVSRRRNESLASLKRCCSGVHDLPGLLQSIVQGLSTSEIDVPFLIVYEVDGQPVKDFLSDSPRRDESDVTLRLVGKVGDFDCSVPEVLDLAFKEDMLSRHMRNAINSREATRIRTRDDDMVADWCRASRKRGYGETCKEMIIFPTSCLSYHSVRGLIILGIASRRPLDEAYSAWIRNLQQYIADKAFAIARTEAREAERRKASDRAREVADINRRELALRKKEAEIAQGKYNSVLTMAETIDVGFFDYLPTGELMKGNDAFYELSGYPRDPALNKQHTFLDYCMEEDAELVMEKWNWLLTGHDVTFEMRWKNDTPTGQWIQAACTPVFDDAGNIVSISGCTTDISAQKLVQENALKRAEALDEVRLSQARLLQFMDNVPIGIVVERPSGGPIYINHSWFKMTGHAEVLSSDVDIKSVCFSDDVNKLMTKQHEAIEQRKAFELQLRLAREWTDMDGTCQGQSWVSIVCFPEFGLDGLLSRVVSTWTDISHLKFSEQIQRERLEEALEAKKRTETFIDITSHEIRNPLGATVHCADLLKESFEGLRKLVDTLAQRDDFDVNQQNFGAQLAEHITSGTEAVETILSCAMHQRRVTDDILSLSKLDSNLLQVSPSTVRAADILDNVFKIFIVEARRTGVVLQTRLDSSLTEHDIDWVTVDPGRVTQVLVNLVTNAIKFTKTTQDERTVSIHLGASKGRPSNLSVVYATPCSPEARAKEELPAETAFYLWFSVIDSGCGMSDGEQTRMFHRFSQASPKTYNQYGGSGLGLFISKRLVELQGGQIGLASQSDIGSRFAFYIAANKAQRLVDPTQKSPMKCTYPITLHPTNNPVVRGAASVGRSRSDCTVLIVEDNLVNQRILQKHLTKLGYKVQTADNGQEALNYVATTNAWRQEQQTQKGTGSDVLHDVHVILMDIEMPVMDGMTCSRRIRDMQSSGDIVRHVPIIAVSANARAEQMKEAFNAGVDDFIAKPFRISDLTSIIVRLVKAT
ncbi:hypothetical protein D6D06_09049 [Aureobasidium pullulans]|nr:hypothetical protein D6D06_09049 [Aureobasidium pullulans]